MRVSSAWLQNWLRRTMINDTEMVTALERAGIEVEQLIVSLPIDEHVIVGLVKKVAQHPGADRLKLAEVDVGQELLHIVCGAPNLKTGMKVAVAQIGSILPSGDKIAKAKLRGEDSEGMLCSEEELGIGKDHSGIVDLPSASEVGARLCDMFAPQSVIDLKTPANRFDLQSVWGLAREIAAMTTADVVDYTPKTPEASSSGPKVSVERGSGHYMLLDIQVDPKGQSSPEIAGRLRASGVRSISPIVDVTNYVMLEIGQPLHAFDAAKVVLPITVRAAAAGETLTTLDGVKRKLTGEDLVIADKSGPIALAGVMGGEATEVTSSTTEILLESASFDAATVRKMAMRHNLRSEASARMERGLPVELQPIGAARAVELFEREASGKLIAVTDELVNKPIDLSISVGSKDISKLAGVSFTPKQVVHDLGQLGILGTVTGDSVKVGKVPWWRPDLVVWQDLAEEVVRVRGYENIPSTIPSWRPKRLVIDHIWPVRRRIRDLLYGAGLFEVITYSFVSAEQLGDYGFKVDEHLKIKNPLSLEQAYLRSSMLTSHLSVAERNRNYSKEYGFYEIANVFDSLGRGKQPNEPLKLAVTLRKTDDGFRYAKGILDALAVELNIDLEVRPDAIDNYADGRSGSVWATGEKIGVIGQIHPELAGSLKIDGELAFFEIELGRLLADSTVRQFSGTSKFPTIKRDISMLVPAGITWQAVREVASSYAVTYVGDYFGNDIPEGKKVMTVRLEVSNSSRTPTEGEAADLESKLLAVLGRKLSAIRRD